jgi:hypothetical protein
MKISRFLGALALPLLFGSSIQAGPIVSLSSPDNLSQIQVGDTVHVDITLAGLNPGDTLELLGASVVFPAVSFGAPSTNTPYVVPNGIVPDVGGYSGAVPAGKAVGLYDTLNLLPPPAFFPAITANGRFFSFTVTALKEGSGTFAFGNDLNSIGFDASGAPLDNVVGLNELSFTVLQSTIPEPASAILLGIGILATAVWARRCPRRKAVA